MANAPIQIAKDNLDSGALQAMGLRFVADQRANRSTHEDQVSDYRTANVSGGSRYQDFPRAWIVLFSIRSFVVSYPSL